jgi:hypothetical protein
MAHGCIIYSGPQTEVLTFVEPRFRSLANWENPSDFILGFLTSLTPKEAQKVPSPPRLSPLQCAQRSQLTLFPCPLSPLSRSLRVWMSPRRPTQRTTPSRPTRAPCTWWSGSCAWRRRAPTTCSRCRAACERGAASGCTGSAPAASTPTAGPSTTSPGPPCCWYALPPPSETLSTLSIGVHWQRKSRLEQAVTVFISPALAGAPLSARAPIEQGGGAVLARCSRACSWPSSA